MFESIRTQVLRVFRVPHDPDPPAGAPGSMRVFRAARNFYKLRLLRWGIGQLAALAGILFSLTFLEELQQAVEEVRVEVNRPSATPASSPGPAPSPRDTNQARGSAAASEKARVKSRPVRSRPVVRRVAERWPWWLFPLLTVLELVGIVLYVLQIPFTYAVVRLDYEMRWYIVTDRSLRIRAGVAAVQESTMSFANVQQVVVSQGPLQRLLGIADLRVQSAGGGGDHQERGGGESLHTGIFHGVDNATEVRDLILERLRAFREAGLGDPDDAQHRHGTLRTVPDPATNAALAAAREVLEEARALRQMLS
ncbi:MAG: PH domain-containing protein [Opitutaceae bacterium]